MAGREVMAVGSERPGEGRSFLNGGKGAGAPARPGPPACWAAGLLLPSVLSAAAVYLGKGASCAPRGPSAL